MLQSILIASTRLEIGLTKVIRTRVDVVVLEGMQQLVEPASQESTERGAQPVDPMVCGKVAVDNGRADGTGRVETGAGKVDACLGSVSI